MAGPVQTPFGGSGKGPWNPKTAVRGSLRATDTPPLNAFPRSALKAPMFTVPWMQAYQAPNLLDSLLTSLPALNRDWRVPTPSAPIIVSQQPTPEALMVTRAFVQTDFSLPKNPAPFIVGQQPLPQTLYGPFLNPKPFAWQDFSPPTKAAPFVVSQQPTPFGPSVVRPFVQTDFSLPARPPGFVVTQQPSQIAIETAVPFHNISELPPAPPRSALFTWSTNLLETTLKSRSVTWVPAGGILIGGHALVIRKAHFFPSGGIHISGAATVIEIPVGGGGVGTGGITAPGFKTNIGLNKTKNWD